MGIKNVTNTNSIKCLRNGILNNVVIGIKKNIQLRCCEEEIMLCQCLMGLMLVADFCLQNM